MHRPQTAARLEGHKAGRRRARKTRKEQGGRAGGGGGGESKLGNSRTQGEGKGGRTPRQPEAALAQRRALDRGRDRPGCGQEHHKVAAAGRGSTYDAAKARVFPRSVVVRRRLKTSHGKNVRRQLPRMVFPPRAARMLQLDLRGNGRDNRRHHRGGCLTKGLTRHTRVPDGVEREQAKRVPDACTRRGGQPRRTRLRRDEDACYKRRRR